MSFTDSTCPFLKKKVTDNYDQHLVSDAAVGSIQDCMLVLSMVGDQAGGADLIFVVCSWVQLTVAVRNYVCQLVVKQKLFCVEQSPNDIFVGEFRVLFVFLNVR